MLAARENAAVDEIRLERLLLATERACYRVIALMR
jgi:hypothetical protein